MVENDGDEKKMSDFPTPAYLRSDGGQVDLGHAQVESLQADVLLQLVSLVEELGLQTPARRTIRGCLGRRTSSPTSP